MPALSPTMEDGAISCWNKEEGDEVGAGDAICEIETDKATVDFELADDGVLARILVGPNTRVKVGDLIGILVEDKSDVGAFKDTKLSDFKEASSESATPPPAETEKPAVVEEQVAAAPAKLVSEPSPTKSDSGGRIFISPFAKKTAKENNVDFTNIKGTGPEGRIVVADIINFMKQQPLKDTATPTASVTGESATIQAAFEDLSVVDNELGQNLSLSKKEAPHYYLSTEISVKKVEDLISLLKGSTDSDISLTDFFIKASAVTMRTVPSANASFRKDFIRNFKDCHINVFLNDKHGLVEDCHNKGLAAITEDTQKILHSEASNLKLGTFSVVSLDVAKLFPIVLHGQSACLGVGEIVEFNEPFENEKGEIDFVTKRVVNVTLSCDHRVVDGAVGAQWLQKFKSVVEEPLNMLL